MWLVEQARPKRIVELGSETGVSLCAFAQAVELLGVACEVHGVDTWQGDLHTGAYDGVREQLTTHIHQERYRSITLHQCLFDEALNVFADGSIDVLHVDGFHTYDAVRHDVETWTPKVSRDGIIMLHDICVRQGDFGVWRYWDELRSRYDTVAFSHSNGLGIVSMGAAFPGWLADVTRRDANGRYEFQPRIKAAFETLGDRLVQTSIVKMRDHEIAALQTLVSDRLMDAKNLDTRLRAAHEALSSAEQLCFIRLQQVEELDARLRAAHQAIAQADALTSRLSDEIHRLRQGAAVGETVAADLQHTDFAPSG